MRYLLCLLVVAVPLWAQLLGGATNARTVGGRQVCSATVTTNCVPSRDANGSEVIGPTLPTQYTIGGTLPAAAAGNTGQVRTVSNGATLSDCTVGGGTAVHACYSTGAAWTAYAFGGPTANQNIREIPFSFDGGGVALSGTITRCNTISYAGTITGVYVIADAAGDATMDILTVALADYTGPASAASITDGAPPSLAAAIKHSDTTLTGWTTAVAANTVICATLSSPATVTWVQGKITVEASQ